MLLTKVQIVDKETRRHSIKMEIANIAANEALLVKWHLEIEVEKEQDKYNNFDMDMCIRVHIDIIYIYCFFFN